MIVKGIKLIFYDTGLFSFFSCLGAEFVLSGANQLHGLIAVNNEKTGVELKLLKHVTPYVPDQTALVGSGSVIAAYAGKKS